MALLGSTEEGVAFARLMTQSLGSVTLEQLKEMQPFAPKMCIAAHIGSAPERCMGPGGLNKTLHAQMELGGVNITVGMAAAALLGYVIGSKSVKPAAAT